DVRLAHVEEVEDIRVGAEASVTHSDTPLVAEGRGHQAVMQTFDDKARQGKASAGLAGLDAAEHGDAGNFTQAFDQAPTKLHLVGEHLVESQLQQSLDRHPKRDCADDVWGTCLLAVR